MLTITLRGGLWIIHCPGCQTGDATGVVAALQYGDAARAGAEALNHAQWHKPPEVEG